MDALARKFAVTHDPKVKPKKQETMRIWKGSSRMARQKLSGTTWHSLTGREKNIIVSS